MRFLILLLFSIQAHAINLEFYKDGVPETVLVDTAVPANTLSYPVGYFDTSGVQIDLATEATLLLLEGKDFATETTLLLLEGKDFATETTLIGVGSDVAGILLDTADIETATESIDSKTPALVSGRVPVDVGTSVLPTGAATEATLSALNGKVVVVDTSDVTVSASALPAGAATETTLLEVDLKLADILTQTLAITNNTSSIDLKLPASLGQTTAAGSLSVVPASNYTPPAPAVPAVLTVKQAAITVGTSAVRLTTDAAAPSATRRRLEFQHDAGSATGSCYYGSSGVTSSGGSRGVLFYPGATKELLNDANEYYAICTAAAQTILVVEAE